MSDDLISRKAVIDILESIRLNDCNSSRRYTAADIQERVENVPTAYNVGAVCKEIKKREKKFREYGEKYHDGEGISAADACAGDIEIVRNGGKKE